MTDDWTSTFRIAHMLVVIAIAAVMGAIAHQRHSENSGPQALERAANMVYFLAVAAGTLAALNDWNTAWRVSPPLLVSLVLLAALLADAGDIFAERPTAGPFGAARRWALKLRRRKR